MSIALAGPMGDTTMNEIDQCGPLALAGCRINFEFKDKSRARHGTWYLRRMTRLGVNIFQLLMHAYNSMQGVHISGGNGLQYIRGIWYNIS